MKFFTPELVMRFRSDDPATADAADAEWEVALADYAAHEMAALADAPDGVRKLASLNLQGCKFVSEDGARDCPAVESCWFAHNTATLTLDPPGRGAFFVFQLLYSTFDSVVVVPSADMWVRWGVAVFWEHDELHRLHPSSPGPETTALFEHRILLSSGEQLVIPFWDVQILSFDKPPAAPDLLPTGAAETWRNSRAS